MPSFDRSLPMILNLTMDRIMPVYRELLADYDLTDQQWRILRVLWNAGDINSVELAQKTLLPKPSLVGILDRLEKKDLISRVRSTTDRRNITIATTAKGMALSKDVLPKVEMIQAHLRRLVSTAEWTAMEAALTTIQDQMKTVALSDILPRDDAN